MSATEKMDDEAMAIFNEVSKRPFAQQAMFFLDSFWDEVGDQTEVIYNVHWDIIKKVDMKSRNINYVHLYEEGADLDFDMGLHLFELLWKYAEDDKTADWAKRFPKAFPVEMTSIVRKKELRDKVDVNFDGRVSFIEYLLYQYGLSPKLLMERQMQGGDINEMLVKAQSALDEVNAKIREYEARKIELTEKSEGTGVKAMRAKNELAQLISSPLAEELRMLLIKAEAAVRKAAKWKGGADGGPAAPTAGSIWWMNSEVETKKKQYGGKK